MTGLRILDRLCRAAVAALCQVCVFCFLVVGAAQAADDQAKRVLILYPFDELVPAVHTIQEQITNRLRLSVAPRIEIFSDQLDFTKFTGTDYTDKLAAFLAQKYENVRFDVIVAISPTAVVFTSRYHEQIAPGARMVYGTIWQDSLPDQALPPDAIGAISEFDVGKTIEFAGRLQPDAKEIYVVGGTGDYDRVWIRNAREHLERLADRYRPTYLTELPLDEILRRVRTLPRNAIVLVLPIMVDGGGQRHVPREAAWVIGNAASAPSYAPVDTFIHSGVVGGYTDTFDDSGRVTADLVIDLLAGRESGTHNRMVPASYRIDARELKRWGLPEARIPAGSILLFEEKSLWQEHGNAILGILAVILAQSGLLTALIVQRHRRQRAESALKDSEERMALAATSANVGLWYVDLDTNRLWATDHCRAMFGLDRSSVLSPASLLPAIHPEDRPGVERAMQRVANGEPFNGQFRLRTADGRIRWLQARGSGQAHMPSGSRRVSGIFKDITEQKDSEAQAELHRREVVHMSRVLVVGELSGALAHELNQPLAAILANAQAAEVLLSGTTPSVDEAIEILHEIVQDDHRAGRVIQRLRSLLKNEPGQWEDLDLNGLVVSTLDLMRSELVGRRIDVRTDLNEALPRIRGDGVQLQQVLLNLIMNAMDAIDAGDRPERRIDIRSSAPGGSVELTIGDTGTGIPPELMSKLFQPFQTTKERGLGLGLSICRSILTSHQGTLRLESKEGEGAVAILSIPSAERQLASVS